MFNWLKKKNKNPADAGKTTSKDPEVKVYTIPARFYNVGGKFVSLPGSTSKGQIGNVASAHPRRRKIILGILIGVGLLGVSAAVVVFSTPELFDSFFSVSTNINTNVNIPKNVNTGTNVNKAINENKNSSASKNDNLNTPAETGSNTNSTPTVNSNLNTPPAVVPVEPEEQAKPAVVVDSVDTDKDGLTDKEESLFGTDKSRPDSDADGYLDGNEVAFGYSPVDAKIKLIDTKLVKISDNKTYNYQAAYPVSWTEYNIEQTGKDVVFNSDTGEFFGVSVESNSKNLTTEEWMKANVDAKFDLSAAGKQKNGDLVGIKSADGLTVYFFANQSIYTVAYNYGVRESINFRSTFSAFAGSFALTK